MISAVLRSKLLYLPILLLSWGTYVVCRIFASCLATVGCLIRISGSVGAGACPEITSICWFLNFNRSHLIIGLAVRNVTNIVRLLSEESVFFVLKSEWSLRSNIADYPSFISVEGAIYCTDPGSKLCSAGLFRDVAATDIDSLRGWVGMHCPCIRPADVDWSVASVLEATQKTWVIVALAFKCTYEPMVVTRACFAAQRELVWAACRPKQIVYVPRTTSTCKAMWLISFSLNQLSPLDQG